jgi:hypothetical protein
VVEGLVVEDAGVDLIRMSDGDIAGSSVRLRVLGRYRPGATAYNDYLDAELVVTSGFANGRLEMCLSPEDLDDWSAAAFARYRRDRIEQRDELGDVVTVAAGENACVRSRSGQQDSAEDRWAETALEVVVEHTGQTRPGRATALEGEECALAGLRDVAHGTGGASRARAGSLGPVGFRRSRGWAG